MGGGRTMDDQEVTEWRTGPEGIQNYHSRAGTVRSSRNKGEQPVSASNKAMEILQRA